MRSHPQLADGATDPPSPRLLSFLLRPAATSERCRLAERHRPPYPLWYRPVSRSRYSQAGRDHHRRAGCVQPFALRNGPERSHRLASGRLAHQHDANPLCTRQRWRQRYPETGLKRSSISSVVKPRFCAPIRSGSIRLSLFLSRFSFDCIHDYHDALRLSTELREEEDELVGSSFILVRRRLEALC